MTERHTPGPWRTFTALDEDGEHRRITKVGPYGDGLVAHIFRGSGSDSITEGDANARLIAAAPELLEACNDVLESLVGCDLICHRASSDSQGKAGQSYRAASQEVEVLKVAIAKATS